MVTKEFVHAKLGGAGKDVKKRYVQLKTNATVMVNLVLIKATVITMELKRFANAIKDGKEKIVIKLFVMINYVIQMVFNIFVKGKCEPKDKSFECNCNPGWNGTYCEKISCRKWRECGMNSNYILMRYLRNT